jgi:hypothetical protein
LGRLLSQQAAPFIAGSVSACVIKLILVCDDNSSRTDLAQLSNFADQAVIDQRAIAIENVRLFEGAGIAQKVEQYLPQPPIAKSAFMPGEFSKATSPPICRSCSRPRSSSCSISRPRARSD